MDMTEVCHHLPSGPQVGFISEKAVIFAPNIIHVIKCNYNPYYRKCDAHTLQKETMDALLNMPAIIADTFIGIMIIDKNIPQLK